VKEFRVETAEELPEAGADHPGAELFQDGQYVDVTGFTKGGTWPGRVWKGQKMPGRTGNRSRTTQSLKIVQVRPEDNAVLIAGNVPGRRGAYVTINPAVKKPAPEAAKA